VHQVMRTAEGVSPVPGGSVATTLALFIIVYGIIFSMGIYYINRLIAKGPPPEDTVPELGLPNRPLSGAHAAGRQALN
jgi:cytochrome d ubiquinol oxidase subunit I